MEYFSVTSIFKFCQKGYARILTCLLHLDKLDHIKQLCCFVQLRELYIALYFAIKKITSTRQLGALLFIPGEIAYRLGSFPHLPLKALACFSFLMSLELLFSIIERKLRTIRKYLDGFLQLAPVLLRSWIRPIMMLTLYSFVYIYFSLVGVFIYYVASMRDPSNKGHRGNYFLKVTGAVRSWYIAIIQ